MSSLLYAIRSLPLNLEMSVHSPIQINSWSLPRSSRLTSLVGLLSVLRSEMAMYYDRMYHSRLDVDRAIIPAGAFLLDAMKHVTQWQFAITITQDWFIPVFHIGDHELHPWILIIQVVH